MIDIGFAIIIVLIFLIIKLAIDNFYNYDSLSNSENFTLSSPTSGVVSKEGRENINSVFSSDTIYATNLVADSLNLIKPKTIIMWHGNTSNVPSGWALCDGKNGTPNLLDNFIMANKLGPAATKQAYINISGTVLSGSAHTHNVDTTQGIFYTGINATQQKKALGIGKYTNPMSAYSLNSDDKHTHASVTVNSTSVKLKPKWASLVFIMKL